MFEFHISRQARDRYQFDEGLFATNGSIIFANFHAARLLAQKINQKRDLVNFPEKTVKAGQLNAMGLVDEILHHIVYLYRQQKNPKAMLQALDWLKERLGEIELDRTLQTFIQDFPPLAVYRKEQTPEEYLAGTTTGVPNRALLIEELVMLWVENKNPALSSYDELISDKYLAESTAYVHLMHEMHEFFDIQPTFGPAQQNLIDMLRSPAIAVPQSITGQLEYIRTNWADLLGRFLYRLLSSLDFIKEEEKLTFSGGPGPVPIPSYLKAAADAAAAGAEAESENFSADREWMPRLVLIAKNSFVWLDQLARKYDRPINHLDQIPDEELEFLAKSGFTGLWLIGLWERSKASAEIKKLCGNPDAISSAYSLFDYRIADDLGGEEAFRNLRDRAWQHGIRLASDMVPNHMGADSPWVTEHSDWFISLPHSPFPAYTFNGPNLSNDNRVGIFLEDHYYNRTDAAVVFKRVDNHSGYAQYVYHGNDGTTMPWNDTAQLNYLNPAVREAVIQTIIQVARRFPIIRFDAAMTLAKRHFQRLWYPEPGSGGAIPSRAEYGLTKDQFEAAIPVEFWREVVDRMAVEAPDTLLLAEAFWLMEGYFVRTLGMHRVYNSAFMNLLRNEDNNKYRLVMKNTLEFDPEILKRFVNFMNNPDEKTAVDQFGKGDKYFGICTLMATLPGLPMFGHGQVEGFAEKYGMEFRRAYWDEKVDPYLVERHQREIFPILHRRALFAGVENFLLYDFFTPEGQVNEDVFAYSNGQNNERALVVFHNRFADTSGWIRTSVGFSVKTGGDQKQIIQRSLSEGLALRPERNSYIIFRDQSTGMEYIRPAGEMIEKGLYIQLHAYEYHVFMEFRQVQDDAWQSYHHLCNYLAGRGVPSISEAINELMLQPVLNPFREIANPGYFSYLYDSRLEDATTSIKLTLLDEAVNKSANLLQGMAYLIGASGPLDDILTETRYTLQTVLSLPVWDEVFPVPTGKRYTAAITALQKPLKDAPKSWYTLIAWVFTHSLGKMKSIQGFEEQALSWLDEWQFSRTLADTLRQLGETEDDTWRSVGLLRLLITQQNWYTQSNKLSTRAILENWLSEVAVQQFLGINRYKEILWFNHEAFLEFTGWMFTLAVFQAGASPLATASERIEQILGAYEIIERLETIVKQSGYQVAKLLAAAEEE